MAPNPYTKQYLMTAGPTPVPPAVSQAMATPMLYHRAPAFVELYAHCLEGLRRVFQTENEVLTFASSGSGGMESAVANLAPAGKALVADSLAAILSSLLGTSTVVSYIESASGVEAGGRTGLTGATTAILFLLALFLTPVILAVPAAATAPALVIVGVFMFMSVAEMKLDDFTEVAPTFLIIAGIPLSFSIAEGIGLGLITYAVLKLVTGRARDTSILTYVLAAIFSLHLIRAIFAHLF